MKVLPAIYYHPTTVVLIDDNKSFTETLINVLPEEHNIYATFTSPNLALEYLQNYRNSAVLQNVIKTDDENQETVNVVLQDIYHEMFNHDRFKKISTVFIDYEMHGVTGIDILEKLQDKEFKKVLLTGVADEKIAIEAFNEGLIDRYIKKHDPNVIELILQSINDNNLKYFYNSSVLMRSSITHTSYLSILQSKEFIELFQNIINQYKIIEYYVCDIQGSIITIDENNKIRILFVRNEQLNKDLYEHAELEGCSNEFLRALQNNTKQICYIEGLTKWEDKLEGNIYDSKEIIIGKESFYYSIVENPNIINSAQVKFFDASR